MRLTGRVIKFIGYFLAGWIIIVLAGSAVTGLSCLTDLGFHNGDKVLVSTEFSDVKSLDLNVKATKLSIVEMDEGSPIKIETTSKYVDQWEDKNTAYVVERSHGIFGFNQASETVVYVRKDVKFERVNIEAGAGTFEMQNLRTKVANLIFGAGSSLIRDINVSEQAKIEVGAGKINVEHGQIRDLKLELGAGKATVNLELLGNNKIVSGLGKLELGLIGEENDYQLDISKGIGEITVNGKSQQDGAVLGDGVATVKIDAGVGAVKIETREK